MVIIKDGDFYCKFKIKTFTNFMCVGVINDGLRVTEFVTPGLIK